MKTVPWVMGQHVQQVCEQYKTGGMPDTLEERAARQGDRKLEKLSDRKLVKSNKGDNTKPCIWARIAPHNSTGWDQLSTENFCSERHSNLSGQRVELTESAMMAHCMLGC